MHVISLKPLRDFWASHPDAEKPLLAWHREAEHALWETFADVREAYPHADKVGRFVIFNIGGNKVPDRRRHPLQPREGLCAACAHPSGI
jgi:mRNA interferase HigB